MNEEKKILNTLRHVVAQISEANDMIEALCCELLAADWKARKREFSTGTTTTRVDNSTRDSDSDPAFLPFSE